MVTGATGNVGTELVKKLSAAGVAVRAAAHSMAKAEKVRGPNVEIAELDFDKPETVSAAFYGVDKAFLLTPFTRNMAEQGKRLVDAAKKGGVKHVVRLSGFGADAEPGIQLGRWHRAVEKHIESSGMGYTILRPNNFMQNFIAHFRAAGGVYYLPLGAGKISYIDIRDIANVAATVLTAPGHEGKAYTLTGGEALTVGEVAGTISAATGKKFAYVDVLEEAARKAMLEHHVPDWMASALMELHAVGKAGYAAHISPDVEAITGKKPITFGQFTRENAPAF
ncbi:MAG: SDR family oxidoreductase [Nitrospinae bacterium]|nr:SDR family oxidoreductase [Nitrospinota bacterium]